MRLPKITFLCLITFVPIIQPFSVLTRRFRIARWSDLNSAVAFNILACVLGWLTLVGLAACSSPWADLQPLPPLTSTDYHLGPGDQIRIITFGDQQMSGEFRVNDSGNIAIPLLGNVQAASLTPKELEDTTAARLESSHLFHNPSVSVEVVAYRPIFVLGEVSKPGEYPYQPGMTIVTAVAVAGGFTYRAVDDVFSVVRTINGKAVEGRANRQTFVAPGDVITVFERRF